MPWNKEHKLKSREKILSSAALLFTRKGFEDVSIDDVMQDAGLTRGAFYAHFKSKSDIYNQAVSFGAIKAREHIKKLGVKNAIEFAEDYLSIGTDENELKYCTLAFLITDIGQRDSKVKTTYTKVLKGYQETLASLGVSKEAAIQMSVQLIGGLAISRAVTDTHLKEQILHNCLEAIKNIVDFDYKSNKPSI